MARIVPWCGVVSLLLLLWTNTASAAPVTADTAARAVKGWLREDRKPLGQALPSRIKKTESVTNKSGEVLFHVVHLEPRGYVILAGDDAAAPVVAFSATGRFTNSAASPLADILKQDLPRRLARARSSRTTEARRQWNSLLAASSGPPPDSPFNDSVVEPSQVYVAPFTQTLWSQTVDVSLTDAVYNYYTPPFAAGSTNNYPCGCVATCMAELMYYFQYPTTSVGTGSFPITVGTTNEQESLMGGPYQWSNMPLSPNFPTLTQAQAIGELTHDTGVSVKMAYTLNNSAADTFTAQQELMQTFQYAHAAYSQNLSTGISGSELLNMINPNLDARLPVMLGIQDTGQNLGHCLLCDGYGYVGSAIFHHLNTGWGGDNDIWYNLPNIPTPDLLGDYTQVQVCIFNIYTNAPSGEIISGRVTDATGAAVAGATITAVRQGGSPYTATTDSNGIYALARVPAASSYTLTATNAQGVSATATATTGTSQTTLNEQPSGNDWGVNFTLSTPLLAIPESGFATIGPVGGPFITNSQSYTLTNTSASFINWSIGNSNAWLTVTVTNGTLAAGATTSFLISLNSAANSLSAGTYPGSVWITNTSNGSSQQLQFSLAEKIADYPIAITGYNADVVVESNAVGGNTYNYADTFDPNCSFFKPPGPICFYAGGLFASNLLGGTPSATGLPANGLITSAVDQTTTFQLGAYEGENVLYLTNGTTSGTLTLVTSAPYKSLTVLAASAQGGGNGTMVIHFADGSTSPSLQFNAANYLNTEAPVADAAITNFGLLITGDYNVYGTANDNNNFPALYQSSVDLHAAGLDGKLIDSVTFTMPAQSNIVTGVFALSGTQAPYTGNYTLNVVASPAVGGAVSGGGSFLAGSTNTVTAMPASNYLFAGWLLNGTVVSTNTDYTFVLNGNETLVANFLTHYRVTVLVSPADGGTAGGGGTFLQGSVATLAATNNDGFDFIGWTGDEATGTANPLNIVVNTNLTITANFAPASGGITWTILTNNPTLGSVTPNLNGKTLVANKNYALKATPAAGNLFSNWTGTITTNKNPLTLKAASNIVLQANFVPNPFPALKGTYNGLFALDTGVAEVTAGMLKGLAVGSGGTYSGSLLIDGGTHVLRGTFSLDLQATNLVPAVQNRGQALTVVLAFTNTGTTAPQLTGNVTGPGGPAALTAYRATNTLSSAEYTLLVPPDPANAPPNESPGGYGYACITNKSGMATITGALADGTAFSESTGVSTDGYVPLFASLYAGKGLLWGWINLNLTNSASNSLAWIHPGTATGLLDYRHGFSNLLGPDQIMLSHWTNLVGLAALNLTAGSATSTVTINGQGQVGGDSVHGTVSPKTGLLTVTLEAGGVKVTAHGAMLDATNGGGYFLTKTNSQPILLAP